MSLRLYAGLFDLGEAVDGLAVVATRRLARERDAGALDTPVLGLVLANLHMELRARLEDFATDVLTIEFSSDADPNHAELALRLVSYWVNERLCSHLEPSDCADWLPVGPEGAALTWGGSQFFSEVDDLGVALVRAETGFSKPTAEPLERLAELSLFILEQGFEGKYRGQSTRLEEYKARLRRRTLPPPGAPVATEPRQQVGFRHAWVVPIAAAAFFYGVCAWISNLAGAA